MDCWFLTCFVLNYPNKQVLSCVFVNNSPASVKKTLVYYIRELNFQKELKNSRTGYSGWYLITCHRQPLQLYGANKSYQLKGNIIVILSFVKSSYLSEHPTISE